MKFRKLVYCVGFSCTVACSLLALEKNKLAEDVKDHYENGYIHDGNVIAHRGFSSLKVENSFNSVKTGFECDCCDGVEIDVRLTKDEELVLSHDSSIPNIGKIGDKTLDELQKAKYKSNNISKLSLLKEVVLGRDGELIYDRYMYERSESEYITTLYDVLNNIDSKKTLLVDIKFSSNDNSNFMNKVNEIFVNYKGHFDIILQANEYDELLKMKERYPDYKYQLIIKKESELEYLNSEFEMFCIRKNLITKDIVEGELEKGRKICVWTINSCNEYEELKDELEERINDIFIITDYPDEICYLNNKKKNLK